MLALAAKTQAQIPTVGPWTPNNNSTTEHDAGVGTLTPRGKQEIVLCPEKDPKNGLIVTSKECLSSLNGGSTGIGNEGSGGTIVDPNNPPLVAINFPPILQTIPTWTYPSLAPNNLFWVRTEERASFNSSQYNFKTHFIVTSEGRTGINTMMPRAQLDVVQNFIGTNINLPTAVFSKRRAGAGLQMTIGNSGFNADAYLSSQMLFFNRLNTGAYNSIIQTGDQAIIYSDGGNTDGSNLNGTFVIAPWGSNGGLRIDALGHTELRGNLRATKVVVNAQWWPDFVFHTNYNLMPLSQVKTFINKNHHLPGMPSQDSVMNSGQDVGELQKLQQQKIEELTLYTIQQDEQLKAQEEKLKALEQKLNSLIKD